MTSETLVNPARAKGAIRRITGELGVYHEALRTWVCQAQDGARALGQAPPPAKRPGSRHWRKSSASRVELMRSCAKRARISPRRSSTAPSADLSVHRGFLIGGDGACVMSVAMAGKERSGWGVSERVHAGPRGRVVLDQENLPARRLHASVLSCHCQASPSPPCAPSAAGPPPTAAPTTSARTSGPPRLGSGP